MSELLAKRESITSNPENRSPLGDLFLYKKAARKKLDSIDHDITHLLAMKRAAAGDPVSCDGYSGRNSNK